MGFLEFNILDILDILLVAFLLFQLYKLTKGTVAIRIFIGIAAIYLLWKLVEALQMELLGEILGQFIGVGVLAVIIVFQQELSRFLLMIGNTKFFSKDGVLKFNWINDETAAEVKISEIVKSCDEMAKTKTGAIIVITRENGLPNYIETGEILNAKTSNIFLQSIFFKNSPLHDGAVIITGDTIKAARCVLPTIENDSFPSNLGMRHRAAAGITENTDSIAIVVSEERGKISVAHKGQLEISLSAVQLKEFLQKELHQ